MEKVTLGTIVPAKVEVNFPESVITMAKCVVDAKELVNKQVVVFGREDDLSHNEYYQCICLLAAALFAEESKKK